MITDTYISIINNNNIESFKNSKILLSNNDFANFCTLDPIKKNKK